MSHSIRILSAISVLLLSALRLPAQLQSGTPPFGSFSGGPDIINNASLNIHWAFPVFHKPGRGMPFDLYLTYDSSVWYPVTSGSTTTWQPVSNFGWAASEVLIGGTTYTTTRTTHTCGAKPNQGTDHITTYSNWTYHDGFGTAHKFAGTTDTITGTCGDNEITSLATTTTDGSGYSISITGNTINSLYGTDGRLIGGNRIQDRNGNYISSDGNGNYTDTLGVVALTTSGSSSAPPIIYGFTLPSGDPGQVTVNYTAYTVATNFGISTIVDYKSSSAVPLVSSIVLPDGSQYSFQYEATPSTAPLGACTLDPGTTACVTARIHQVALPTGGTITYTYTGGNNGVWPDGSTATLTRVTPDGTWSYAQVKDTGSASHTTITDPTTAANQTVIQFQGIYETQRQVYQGSSSGTLLATTNTCYNGAASPCNSTAVALPILRRSVITTLPAAGSSTIATKQVAIYNGVGVPTEVDSYAYGLNTPPATPLEKTLVTYASLAHITGFRQTVTEQNGAGTPLALTNYNYDGTTPIPPPTGTPPQLASVTGSRGNLTSVDKCLNVSSCSNKLTTSITYDTAGQIQRVTDARANATTFGYADNFFTDTGSDPAPQPYTSAVPTDAYVTQVTVPRIGAATFGYYFYSGQTAISTDQNNNSSYNHFQDTIGRLTTQYGPTIPGSTTIRPWVLNTYASSHIQVDSYLGIMDTTASTSCSSCRHDQVLLDSSGRVTAQQLVSDPEGATTIATNYDAVGRVMNVSHPARSASSPTDGVETPTYDALGRTIKVTHQDGSFLQTFYGRAVSGTGVNTAQLCSSATYGLGFPVLFMDEAGKKREVWSDAFGRTIEADEPDSSGNLTSNACYQYDPIGNLLQVVHGSQTRTYGYDVLSRPTSATNPELANSTGTNCAVTYTYDGNSNLQEQIVPAPNQTTCTSTVTQTFYYDELNRLTKKTYSDGSPTIQYGYDGVALTGCTTTPPSLTDSNAKGRLTSMCDGSGATSWAHDAFGHVLTESRTLLGITKNISYAYNLDGSIATVTYPGGSVVTYTVSNAQRLTSAKDLVSATQFALVASYAPIGALQSVVTGQISGGFGGVTESHAYNNRLEYTSSQAVSSAGTALDLSLAYSISGGNNGTVSTITNNADSGRTQSFVYDPLSRILSAASSATTGVDCWGQTFGPDGAAADDVVANLTNINSGTQTSPSCPLGRLVATTNAHNHITTDATYAYDAPGNMTQDGSGYTYTFDDDNHLTLASGMTDGPYCYVYDGNGLRVAKKSGATTCASGTVQKLYWRSISGVALAETDSTGNTTNVAYSEFVFFSGRRIASRNGTGGVFYYFPDQLGSTRTITTGSGPGQTPGQLCYDADFTPYGQEISHTERLQTTACPTNYKFTGYERDPETGLDYAFARYYSSRLGRFISVDPLGGSLGDPQSLNGYAYVLNNPANLIDPSGLCGHTSHLSCKITQDPHFPDGGVDDFPLDFLYGLLGLANGDEFGLIRLAFVEGLNWPGCPYGDCSRLDRATLENNLLSLFGDPSGGDGWKDDPRNLILKVKSDCFDKSQGWRETVYDLTTLSGDKPQGQYTVWEEVSDISLAPPWGQGSDPTPNTFDDTIRPALGSTATSTSVQYFVVSPNTIGNARWVPINRSGSTVLFNNIKTIGGGFAPQNNVILVNGKKAPPC